MVEDGRRRGGDCLCISTGVTASGRSLGHDLERGKVRGCIIFGVLSRHVIREVRWGGGKELEMVNARWMDALTMQR